MFFDSILDRELYPIFDGTPDEIKEWLEEHPKTDDYVVRVGDTLNLISVPEYLFSSDS